MHALSATLAGPTFQPASGYWSGLTTAARRLLVRP